jgi:hypothetical protein
LAGNPGLDELYENIDAMLAVALDKRDWKLESLTAPSELSVEMLAAQEAHYAVENQEARLIAALEGEVAEVERGYAEAVRKAKTDQGTEPVRPVIGIETRALNDWAHDQYRAGAATPTMLGRWAGKAGWEKAEKKFGGRHYYLRVRRGVDGKDVNMILRYESGILSGGGGGRGYWPRVRLVEKAASEPGKSAEQVELSDLDAYDTRH